MVGAKKNNLDCDVNLLRKISIKLHKSDQCNWKEA